ncbi:hypothetical protein [Azonexus fungiphilus]|uniref:hypothetical protein n=1 Tax=Azonexus fungiphilus TaxID=146940 RepID=UPI00156BD064|nr:hypothetical protein [Azonexus fungiphilus]NHC08362.1 hypothetical protein [Azonexus fungiphilus]
MQLLKKRSTVSALALALSIFTAHPVSAYEWKFGDDERNRSQTAVAPKKIKKTGFELVCEGNRYNTKNEPIIIDCDSFEDFAIKNGAACKLIFIVENKNKDSTACNIFIEMHKREPHITLDNPGISSLKEEWFFRLNSALALIPPNAANKATLMKHQLLLKAKHY